MIIDIEGKSVSELRWLNAQGLVRVIEIPEYTVWVDMRRRCSNPDYPAYHYYGGRGIGVCAEWSNSFWAWLEYLGRRPWVGLTLDRINNNLGYQPGNVRWTTMKVQNNNKRMDKLTKVTDEQVIEIRGRRGIYTQADTALEFGISNGQVAKIQLGDSHNTKGLVERPPKLTTGAVGERNGCAILTEADVANIKGLLLLNPWRGFRALLADRYNVARSIICRIASGEIWVHVQPSLHPIMPPSREPPIQRRMGL